MHQAKSFWVAGIACRLHSGRAGWPESCVPARSPEPLGPAALRDPIHLRQLLGWLDRNFTELEIRRTLTTYQKREYYLRGFNIPQTQWGKN